MERNLFLREYLSLCDGLLNEALATIGNETTRKVESEQEAAYKLL